MMRQPRQHNEKHLAWIRQLPCCVCQNNIETEAAHVRFSCIEIGKRKVGIGEKPHDKWTVPYAAIIIGCSTLGASDSFWKAVGKDPIAIAQELWANSGQHGAGVKITAKRVRESAQ
jgi:hypothetical protein